MKKKQKITCLICDSGLKIKKCSQCGGSIHFFVKDEKEYLLNKKAIEKINEIFLSSKSFCEKKNALLNLLKSLDLEKMPGVENQKIKYLLQSRLFNELAKKNMEEYEKSTSDFLGR